MSKTKLTLAKLDALKKRYSSVNFDNLEIEFSTNAFSSFVQNDINTFLSEENLQEAVESGATNAGPFTPRMIGYYFGISENSVRYKIDGIQKVELEGGKQGFFINESHRTFADVGVTNQDIGAFWNKNSSRFKTKSKMPSKGSPNDVGRRFVRRQTLENWIKANEPNYRDLKMSDFVKGMTFYNRESGKDIPTFCCFDLHSIKQRKLFAV